MQALVLVVIPVYNHGASLRQVVERALAVHPHVLVVDDGSSDGGPASIRGLVPCIRLEKNCGKGAALRAGAAAARGMGASHIISLDADGQHYPEDIPLFVQAIAAEPKALFIGCRDFSVAHVPGTSRFGRVFSNFWMRLQTGVVVSDMQSGYRAYPLEVFEELTLSASHYSFEVEIAVRAAWAGYPVRDVPVRVYYPPAEKRVSHFKAVQDNIRISLLNTRLTLRALVPLPFVQHATAREERVSLRRPLASLRYLLRQRATPRALGRSAALSVAVSTLPLPGLQSILVLWCIGSLRLNRLCALAVIPLTWPPFVPGLCVLAGYRLRHGTWLTEFSLRTLGHELGQRVLDWVLGALVMAPLLGLAAGLTVWAAASGLACALPKSCDAPKGRQA